MFSDLRFSFRLLRKQPAFVFVASACLALGIGANAGIFSLLNALLLRNLPVHDAGRLVVLHRGKSFDFAFRDYQDLAVSFQKAGTMLATVPTESSIDRAGYQGELVTAEAVTGNYARVLQTGTLLGDWFDNEDSPAAVISYRTWQDLFHGDPKALGQQVRSETQWYTVAGVAPKEFTGLSLPRSTGIWIPLRIWARQYPNMQARLTNRDSPLVMIFARLSGAIRYSDATAELGVIAARLNRQVVRRNVVRDPITIDPVRGVTASGDRARLERILDLLFAMAGIVLLICCVNTGNLLLVRGSSREKEIAIRYSLGATRGHILRQFLMDSVLLAMFGAMSGLSVDVLLVHAVLRLVPALPLGETISPNVPLDWRVIAFVGAGAVVSVFLFGLLPAWRMSANRLSTKLGRSPGNAQGAALRKSCAIAQVALSLLLLVIAGLFLDACRRLQGENPGFAIRNRLYATTYVSKPEFKREQIPGFYGQVLANLRSMPNVRSAALTYLLPLNVPDTECIQSSSSGEVQATTSTISPGFLRTLDIPLLHGRDFGRTDATGATSVILINQLLAEKLWPNSSAVGREVQVGCGEPMRATVVGVTANSKTVSLTEAFRPHLYRPFAQNPTGLANIVVATSGAPGAMREQLRRTLLNQGHGIRVYAVNELSHHVEQSCWQLRWESWLPGAFAAAALSLAALGLYGVISYTTALRTKEFGIRIALGARSGDILRLIVKEGGAIGIMGSGVGSIGAFALAGFLRDYVFAARVSIALTCLAVSFLWLIVVTGACYVPARRSSRVEPSITLRCE